MTDLVHPQVIASVTGLDASCVLTTIGELPRACRLVELRADRLSVDAVRRVVAESRRELIVTVRRAVDGGGFDGDEPSRLKLLRAALDSGARYIDIEWDGAERPWMRELPVQRRILSHHGSTSRPTELLSLYERMSSIGAAVIKIVPHSECAADAFAVESLLRRAGRDGQALICFGLGRYGLLSRLLTCCWGGWATYGAVGRGAETAAGQPTVNDLLEVYAVARSSAPTRRFALFGAELRESPSPAMHRAAYAAHGIDAVYLPIDLRTAEECATLVQRLGLEGFAVTNPFKSSVAADCILDDELARRCACVNTVSIADGRWHGHNTDGPAAVGLVSSHLSLRGRRVAVAGAGGTGKAMAHAFRAAGAQLSIFNRGIERARELARAVEGTSHPLGELESSDWDVLVQATTLGRSGDRWLARESLRGRVVLEVNYGVRPTPLIGDAQRAGLASVDGLQLLAAQAALQFRLWTGRSIDAGQLLAAAKQWQLEGSG